MHCAGMFASDSSPTAALQERPEAILPTMGGQTALNLAKALAEVSQRVHQFLYLTTISFLPWQPLARDMQMSCSLSEMPHILVQQGILEKYNVELIGAKLPSIDKAEDRELFKQVSRPPFKSTCVAREHSLQRCSLKSWVRHMDATCK